MKVFCCDSSKDLCKDFNCTCEKTEKGFTVTFTGENKEKIDALHVLFKDCGENKSSGCC